MLKWRFHIKVLTASWTLIWDKVFKNGPSKIYGGQPLKNFTWSIFEYFIPYVALPIVGKLSGIRRDRFYATHATKKNSVETPFYYVKAFLKLQQIIHILYEKEKNCLNIRELITSVVYLHIILFSMHERDKATEKETETVSRMALAHVHTQRFRQSTVPNGQQR